MSDSLVPSDSSSEGESSVVLSRSPVQLAKFLVANTKEVNRMLRVVVQDEEIKASLVGIARRIAAKAAAGEEREDVKEVIDVGVVESSDS